MILHERLGHQTAGRILDEERVIGFEPTTFTLAT
jgi:hypothetical protein